MSWLCTLFVERSVPVESLALVNDAPVVELCLCSATRRSVATLVSPMCVVAGGTAEHIAWDLPHIPTLNSHVSPGCDTLRLGSCVGFFSQVATSDGSRAPTGRQTHQEPRSCPDSTEDALSQWGMYSSCIHILIFNQNQHLSFLYTQMRSPCVDDTSSGLS